MNYDIVCNYIYGESPIAGSIGVMDTDLKRRDIGKWIARYLSVGSNEWLIKMDPDCMITGPIEIPHTSADVIGTLTEFRHGVWPLGGAYAIRRSALSAIIRTVDVRGMRFVCHHYIDRRGVLTPIEEDVLSMAGSALRLQFADWPGANIRYRPYWQTTEILDTAGFVYHPYIKELDNDLPIV